MSAQTKTTRARMGFFTVRNRLLIGILLVVLVPVIATQWVGISQTRSSLQRRIDKEIFDTSQSHAQYISNALTSQINLLRSLSYENTIQARITINAIEYADTNEQILQTLLEDDQVWLEAGDDAPIVLGVLNNSGSSQLRTFQTNISPAHTEIFVTDRYGGLVSATNRTSDYYQADEEWWQAAWNDGNGAVFIDDKIQFDPSANIFGINLAVPVFDPNGAVFGVLRSTYNVEFLQDLVRGIEFGETGYAALVDSAGQVLISPFEQDLEDPQVQPDLIPILSRPYNFEDGNIDTIRGLAGEQAVVASSLLTTDGEIAAIDNLGWHVVLFQSEEEALDPVRGALNAVLLAVVIVVALSLVAGYLFSLTIVRPIADLTRTATRLAEGDLSTRAKVSSRDELGVLSSVMNDMAAQLDDLVESLETRVADRTHDLQVAARVSEQVATILDPDELLPHVVELTKDSFDLYHVHIYLYDTDRAHLVLAVGAGDAGRIMKERGHRIPIAARSLVTQAVREDAAVIVDDVQADPNFLANPLLPDTRSEAALPLTVGDRVIGVLDVQSEQVARFDGDLISVLSTLAGQIAVSLDNARLFSEMERASRQDHVLGAITQEIQRATSMDDVLRSAARELGKALRVSETVIELHLPDDEHPEALSE